MDNRITTLAAGIGLFLAGVGATYWLMADSPAVNPPAEPPVLTEQSTAAASSAEAQPDVETLTHERFLAEADARRDQRLADQAEADRLAKLRQMKADSVDCKFWRQQHQTSSTAAKIEEKIKTHCFLASDLISSAAASSESSE